MTGIPVDLARPFTEIGVIVVRISNPLITIAICNDIVSERGIGKAKKLAKDSAGGDRWLIHMSLTYSWNAPRVGAILLGRGLPFRSSKGV